MARRDGLRPQVDFPQLIADVIDQLNVRGPLGVLNLSDEVRPVFIIGSRPGSLQVTSQPVAFPSASVFFGEAALPAANTIVVDTGVLPAGDYDVLAHISSHQQGAASLATQLQHRDAANAATLAVLLSAFVSAGAGTAGTGDVFLPLIGYTLAINERLRVITPASNAASGGVSATIFAQRRVSP